MNKEEEEKEKEKTDKKAEKLKIKLQNYYNELKAKVESCLCVLLTTYEEFCLLEKSVDRTYKTEIKYLSICKHIETIMCKTFMNYDIEPILCKKCPIYTMEDGKIVKSKNVLMIKNKVMADTNGYTKDYYKKLKDKIKKCSSHLLITYEEFSSLRKNVLESRNVDIIIKMTCTHDETITCRTFMEEYEDGPTVCEKCSKITLPDGSIAMSRKLYGSSITSYENYVKIFQKNGCTIITKEHEYIELRKHTNNADEVYIKYTAKCGHDNTIQIKSFLHQNCGRNCYKCSRKTTTISNNGTIEYNETLINIVKNKFKEYKQFFLNEGCIITSSEDEFIESRKEKDADHSQYVNVDYIAKCGHETDITVHSFKYDGCGRNCKECNCFINKNEDGSSKTVKMEDLSVEYMISILQNDFEIKKNISGCLSDYIIRPKSIMEDTWLMIQQKTTEKPRPNKYKFHVNKNYIDCIICCLCLEDKKMWLFDGNNIDVNYGISIGRETSIHSSSEVNVNNIVNTLLTFYNNSTLFTFSETNIPLSYYTRREQEFRIHRELKCDFLNFEYSELSALVYDFTINGKKFQEKVSDNSVFYLKKSNGNKNQPYKKGDNDYYWLHLIDKKTFLIIPEDTLIDKNNVLQGSVFVDDLERSKWSKYIFNYDNIDIDKFFKICCDI